MPIVIDETDNSMPRSGFRFERLTVKDIREPVVQVLNQRSEEILYTIRISGTDFTPAVPIAGLYTVRVFDPDRGIEIVYRDTQAANQPR